MVRSCRVGLIWSSFVLITFLRCPSVAQSWNGQEVNSASVIAPSTIPGNFLPFTVTITASAASPDPAVIPDPSQWPLLMWPIQVPDVQQWPPAQWWPYNGFSFTNPGDLASCSSGGRPFALFPYNQTTTQTFTCYASSPTSPRSITIGVGCASHEGNAGTSYPYGSAFGSYGQQYAQYNFFCTTTVLQNVMTTVTVSPTVPPPPQLGPAACEAACGQPIDATTGNTYLQQQDYSIPGLGSGFRLVRTWNSMWTVSNKWEQVGMFGDSWQSNLEEHLQPFGGELYWRGDGSAWQFTYDSVSHTYALTSPPDARASLTFNTTTSQFVLTLADGTQRVFSQPGYLQAIIDRSGNRTALSYDSSNRVNQVTDPALRVVTLSYGNSAFPSLVTSVQDAVGTVVTYGYDANAHLTNVTYADGSAINLAYDTSGLLLSTTDSQGKVLEAHTYDSSRRGLTSQRANGVDLVSVSYVQWTANLSDSNGNTTQYSAGTSISGKNFLTGISGSGCDTCGGRGNYSFVYDSSGNRTSSTDPLYHLTKYSYDANGNVTQKQIQSDPTGQNFQIWNYTYNSFGEILTATDPLGHQTVNTYDSKGNLLTTTTPSPGGSTAGSKTTFTYDTKGELTSITDPNKNKTSIFYTTAGLIDHITDAQSHTTKFTYDLRGNRTAVIDANNQQTTFTYDSMNRLTKITYPTSPATFTQFGYDYRGRKISVTDPNNKVTQYAYDDADRLISVTDANNGVTHYGYDNESNLTTITDAAGNPTTFQYDPYGHITQVAFPSSWTETYSYDLDGNLLTKTDRNGHLINYAYDTLNRLTSKSYPDGSWVAYTYDDANRLTSAADPNSNHYLTYDNMNRLTFAMATYPFASGRSFGLNYSYDANSNRISMSDPQSQTTSYIFDTLNRLTTLTYPTRTNYTFSYDALSRRTQLTRPNGVNTNYAYDNLSRLTSILHQTGSRTLTTIDGATYVYDAAGNRTSKTDKRTNVTSTYSYDPLYELTQVLQGATTTENYSYDAVGNRLSSLGVSPYSYNSSNELTSRPTATYTYDNNGNTLTKTDSTGTTQYSWDFENRLASVVLPGSGGTVSFKYDPFGRRIQKSSSSGTTNYVYDGANVLQEVDGSGNVLGRYVQSPGIDQPLAETRGSTTSYYEADGLGSITSLTNSSAALANTYTYDSFGKITGSSGTVTNALRYTGRDLDSETGLSYYRARYYDSGTGRFVNEDPSRFLAGINHFVYTLDNPVNFADPRGLDTTVIFVWDNPINHAAVYIDNGGKTFDGSSVIYDPGGSFSSDHSCGSGDACTDYSLDSYVDYYKQNYPDSKVDLIRFPTTPEEEAEIAKRIEEHGGSPGTCSLDTGRVLRGIGPFKDLGRAFLPGGLRDEVMKAHDAAEVFNRELLRKLVPKPPDFTLPY